MKKLFSILLISIGLFPISMEAQVDLSVQYDHILTSRDGKIISIIVDTPVKNFSLGAGIQYALLDDYAFLPVIGTQPDGTIGKGNGVGFHINTKVFFTNPGHGLFGELSNNLQFINQSDMIDNGMIDAREKSYSVIQATFSVGYLYTLKKGFIVSTKLGYGIESFRDFNDESRVDNVFKISFSLGRRFGQN